MISFNSTINRNCIQVDILEDEIIESDEVFQLQLSTNDPVFPAVNVTIVDNDCKSLAVQKYCL